VSALLLYCFQVFSELFLRTWCTPLRGVRYLGHCRFLGRSEKLRREGSRKRRKTTTLEKLLLLPSRLPARHLALAATPHNKTLRTTHPATAMFVVPILSPAPPMPPRASTSIEGVNVDSRGSGVTQHPEQGVALALKQLDAPPTLQNPHVSMTVGPRRSPRQGRTSSTHGSQGEILVPPYTRGSVFLSRAISVFLSPAYLLSRRVYSWNHLARRHNTKYGGQGESLAPPYVTQAYERSVSLSRAHSLSLSLSLHFSLLKRPRVIPHTFIKSSSTNWKRNRGKALLSGWRARRTRASATRPPRLSRRRARARRAASAPRRATPRRGLPTS
jgi:hypothetical protein